MAKFQDSVETLITARNEVAGELRQAERQMEATRRRERQRLQEHQRKQKGIVGRLGGVRGTLDVLAGGAGIGIIMRMGQGVENLATKAADLRGQLEAGEISASEMRREMLRNIPVFGQSVRIGEALQRAFSDAAKRVREMGRAVEALQEFQNEELPRRFQLMDQADQARHDREMMRVDEAQGKRLEAERQLEAQLRAIREQQQRDDSAATIAAANEAKEQVQALHRERMRQLARDEREQRREQEKERERAVRDADQRIRQTRLELTGETHKAEMLAITQQMNERMRAAREAGNRELAIRENILGSIRLEEARANHERERELEQLAERQAALAEQEKERAAEVARARQREKHATADLPQLNQERFLTGVRQQTEQRDRSVQAQAQQQTKLAEQTLAELRRNVKASEESARALREAPVFRAENL